MTKATQSDLQQVESQFMSRVSQLHGELDTVKYRSRIIAGASPGGGADDSGGDDTESPTVLNLHFEGASGSRVITDSSKNSFEQVESSVVIDTSQFKYGASSGFFDGFSDVKFPDSSEFDFGDGDFTIEMWIRQGGGGSRHLISKYDTGAAAPFAFFKPTSNTVSLYMSSNGTGWDLVSGLTIANGMNTTDWYHLAVTREGTAIRTFQDGVLKSTATVVGPLHSNTSSLRVGMGTNSSPTRYLGYMDDLRLTKGVARYTADFTPGSTEET